ncbi:MAG: TlpA disulfide reductase family protein [Desulfomonilia bacterium]|jgi:peroxiredoxin
MIRKIVAGMALMLMAALPIASCNEGGPGGRPPVSFGEAPGFSLKDLSGKVHHFEDYRGKVVLLNFTTTWCPTCRRDVSKLKKTYDRWRGPNFELLSIYLEESPEKVSSFARSYDLPYPVLLDTEGTIARRYQVRGVPTKVIVTPEGNMVCWMCQDVDKILEGLLKRK